MCPQSRTELPSRGRPHSEKTGEKSKTCAALPKPGNAPHNFRHFHSVPRLLNRAPASGAMLTKDRVLLAPSHRASPRSRSWHRRGRRLIYPPSGGCQRAEGSLRPAPPSAVKNVFDGPRKRLGRGDSCSGCAPGASSLARTTTSSAALEVSVPGPTGFCGRKRALNDCVY